MELQKLLQIVKNAVAIVNATPVRPADFQAVSDVLAWLNAVQAAVEKQVAEAAAKTTPPTIEEAPKA